MGFIAEQLKAKGVDSVIAVSPIDAGKSTAILWREFIQNLSKVQKNRANVPLLYRLGYVYFGVENV